LKREIVLEARPESLQEIRDFIGEACREAGVGTSDSRGIQLAVDEACSNVVEHGYAGKPPGPIRVSFEAGGERIAVVVADRGRPFDPADAPVADVVSDWEKRPIGGLGWHLIRQLVDEIGYESDGAAGNRLTLIIRRRESGEGKKGKGD
jgi:serine/threonine-protein kinase RsbW